MSRAVTLSRVTILLVISHTVYHTGTRPDHSRQPDTGERYKLVSLLFRHLVS
jgi:hypothetical protein